MRKIITVIFCVCILICSFQNIYAEENNDDEIIHSRFYVLTSKENHTMEVNFNRNWFKTDARVYQHDLAKLSLGLAVAAFRPKRSQSEDTDMNLTNFLTEAHFTDLRSDDYDKDPNKYTVSTVMGHQKIEDDKEGDFELIAVGVCGQGYLDEWESNFTVGNGLMHEGFKRSSQLVFDRIFGYISANHLSGRIKIWISGFSRAAAISNITAAMLSDSDTFGQDSVYAYTFATPRTVIDKEYERYENIYNIVGKTDPVPNVPFADWGYERYGHTFYLPALETDSDFLEKSKQANVVYKDITGIDYWYNKEANTMLRTILSYSLEICPNVDIYTDCLQEKLIGIWENTNPVNVLSKLLEIANDKRIINEKTIDKADWMLNYLFLILSDYQSDRDVFQKWNSSASTAANLVQAHTPELYISWIYSIDDITELYNTENKYTQIYLLSSEPIYLKKDGQIIEKIDPIYRSVNGRDVIEKKKAPAENNYLDYIDDKIVATIPRDNNYSLTCEVSPNNIVTLFIMDYEAGKQQATKFVASAYETRYDSEYMTLSFDPSGKVSCFGSRSLDDTDYYETELSASTSDTLMFTRSSIYSVSWRDRVLIAISLVLLIICVITTTLVYFIGKIRFNLRVKKGWISKNAKFRALPVICCFAIFLLFLIKEFYGALFPDSHLVQYLFKALIGLIAVYIAYMGYRNMKQKLYLFIMISMIELMFADIVITYDLIPGSLLYFVAYLTLIYAYIDREPPQRSQIIIWLVLCLIGIILISPIDVADGRMKFLVIIYMCVALLMIVSSFTMPKRAFYGSILLFIAGILLIINEYNGMSFGSHILSLGIYYIAIATLASTGNKTVIPKLVPKEEQ